MMARRRQVIRIRGHRYYVVRDRRGRIKDVITHPRRRKRR